MTGKWTRRATVGAGLAALIIAADSGAKAQTLRDLTGTYRAEGRNPDGSTYSGQAVIAQQGGVVQIAWQVGAQSYSGQGTFDGRVLSVDWGDTHPVVYVLMSDGTLHGTWSNGRALERLSR
ncbi:hypothetical protein [Aestuariivita sp.]|jgi:hypothetical protein|uniref:LIC10280 family protein n=1 Tax=Aestuariivita sp. TaxID=1872407 RepID=UPI002174240E|nr:hypothetical protein [Aestuariivita sp.]MCE8008683.1 hypothetical protein [Aestuariivita sp.]